MRVSQLPPAGLGGGTLTQSRANALPDQGLSPVPSLSDSDKAAADETKPDKMRDRRQKRENVKESPLDMRRMSTRLEAMPMPPWNMHHHHPRAARCGRQCGAMAKNEEEDAGHHQFRASRSVRDQMSRIL